MGMSYNSMDAFRSLELNFIPKVHIRSANNVPVAMAKEAVFYLIIPPASAWLGQLAANAGWNAFVVEVLIMLANFVLEFLHFKYFVFWNKK